MGQSKRCDMLRSPKKSDEIKPFTFEYDDYPRGARLLLRRCDRWARRFPNFKCNVFAIPNEMTKRWFREIEVRPYMRLYPHGFDHQKGECRGRRVTRRQKDQLRKLAEDPRWGKVFKAPHHGMSPRFISTLIRLDFIPCISNLNGMPFPIPRNWQWWCRRDAIAESGQWGDWRSGMNVEAHPVYNSLFAPSARRTQISLRNCHWWSRMWEEDSQWDWVEDRAVRARKLVHLGCGPHVWRGWMNLDPRTSIDPRIRYWTWDQQIPLSDNKADIVFSSHTLNYMPEDKYEEAFLEIWRVLRPGGIYRLAEDRSESGYVWRQPGQRSRGTGTLRSCPSQERAIEALKRVGFTVYTSSPGITRSPHESVLKGDSRRRRWVKGQKYYAEAIKEIDIDMGRVRMYDKRATRRGRYRLPPG